MEKVNETIVPDDQLLSIVENVGFLHIAKLAFHLQNGYLK